MRWQRYLRNLYRNLKKGGSYQSAQKLYETVKREGKWDISLYWVKKWLEGEDTYTLNKEVRRKFGTNLMPIADIDSIWEADLAELGKFSAFNDGYKYLLGCIDTFSRKLYVRPLKTKRGVEIVDGLKSIFDEDGRRPRTIRTDRGSEFTNAVVSKYLSDEGIGQSFTSNQSQAAYIERCWKSIKKRMTKYMQDRRTWKYIDVLQDLVKGYNSTFHSVLKAAPNDVNANNKLEIEYNQLESRTRRKKKKTKRRPKQAFVDIVDSEADAPRKFLFRLGTPVRISLKPDKLSREYTERWSTEIFHIRSRKMRNGVPVYKVRDSEGEVLFGSFYTEELQRVEEPKADKLYDIDKIIRERVSVDSRGKKTKEYFVSFKGYHSKFNQWLPESAIKKFSR